MTVRLCRKCKDSFDCPLNNRAYCYTCNPKTKPTKKCLKCNVKEVSGDNRVKYCPDCKIIVRRANNLVAAIKCYQKSYPSAYQPRNCKHCELSFMPNSSLQSFCDAGCRSRFHNGCKSESKRAFCLNCNIQFKPIKGKMYCNKDCQKDARKSRFIKPVFTMREGNCAFCGSSFETYANNRIYCDKKCKDKAYNEKRPKIYKSGITSNVFSDRWELLYKAANPKLKEVMQQIEMRLPIK